MSRIYIRNLRYSPVRFHIGKKKDGDEITLKRRGERGDIEPVNDEVRNDRNYITNKELLVFEEISEAEARSIIAKQSKNINENKVNPVFEALRNEFGERYENSNPIRVRKSNKDDTITVAKVDPESGDLLRPEPSFNEGQMVVEDAPSPTERGAAYKVPGSVDNPIRSHVDELNRQAQRSNIGDNRQDEIDELRRQVEFLQEQLRNQQKGDEVEPETPEEPNERDEN